MSRRVDGEPAVRPPRHPRHPRLQKPPRLERSAGVVLFRDTPDGRLFLLLDYGRHWDYPKGHLEDGETDEQAAVRELAEETGITDVTILPGFTHEISYDFFSSRKGPVRKTVVFFAARTSVTGVRLSEEHVGSLWLPVDDALERVTFQNAKQTLAAVASFLEGVRE